MTTIMTAMPKRPLHCQYRCQKWRQSNGRSEPDYETLKKLADYYKVTIDYLLTGTEKKKNIEDEIADPDLQIAYRDMQEFSPESRQQAIEFIQYLKEKEKKRKPGDKQNG